MEALLWLEDQLTNAMEHYTYQEWIVAGKHLNITKTQMADLWNGWAEMDVYDRMNNGFGGWREWILNTITLN